MGQFVGYSCACTINSLKRLSRRRKQHPPHPTSETARRRKLTSGLRTALRSYKNRAATRRPGELDGADVGARHLRFLGFAWIVSRVDAIDRPRPNTMDLKDGLFLGPGEVAHLGLRNHYAAGWYSLGLGGIKRVRAGQEKYSAVHFLKRRAFVKSCMTQKA